VSIIPLSAIINGERVIGPDLSDSEWSELKAQHRKGLTITMPCCGMSGHARMSKCGLKHFYHAQRSGECGGEPESLDHLRLKNQIYQICKAEGWDAQPEYQSPAGDWRADVYATRGERSVVFEVQLSKISQEELQERERKYARDGIESYWLLRNYLDIRPHYEMNEEDEDYLNYLDYLNLDEGEFSLTREKFYYVKKGIRTIGINSDNRTLCTTKNPSTELMEWVKCTLSGDYSHYLVEYKAQYQRDIKLRNSALPVLYELEDFEQKYDEYQLAPYELYAIFKNNTWDDCASLKEEIKLMYASFRRFENALTDIFSPKNGFTWKIDPGSGEKYKQFKLISENQISSIREQVRDLKEVEAKFSSIFNDLRCYLEKKPRKNLNVVRIIRKEALHNPNNRKQEQGSHKPNDRKQEKEEKVDFEFLKVLPTVSPVSQRGWKYNNPYGCMWPINKDDAIEFEQKGYGKIVKRDSP